MRKIQLLFFASTLSSKTPFFNFQNHLFETISDRDNKLQVLTELHLFHFYSIVIKSMCKIFLKGHVMKKNLFIFGLLIGTCCLIKGMEPTKENKPVTDFGLTLVNIATLNQISLSSQEYRQSHISFVFEKEPETKNNNIPWRINAAELPEEYGCIPINNIVVSKIFKKIIIP